MRGLSSHAADRCVERDVPPQMVHWLLRFGIRMAGRAGCTLLRLTARGIGRLRAAVDPATFAKLKHCLDACAVLSANGRVVTVYRTGRA